MSSGIATTRLTDEPTPRRRWGLCVDHVIVLSATGLQRLMKLYCAYYERSRTHLSLNKDAPIPRPIAAPREGRTVAIPQVGGLHHRYERQAA
jgi:putative transposase